MTRRSVDRYALLAAAVVGVLACSVATKKAARTLPDRIAFSHHVHTEQGLECGDCHPASVEGENLGARSVPGKAGCADCHDVEDQGGCATCHSNPSAAGPRSRIQVSGLRFSHQSHEARGALCQTCHPGAAHWPDLDGKNPERPDHQTCAACHKKALDAGRCGLCHERLDLDAQRPERIFTHDAGFFERHGVQAQGNEDLCGQCHDQSFCADCHAKTIRIRPSLRYPERADRSFIHRGDWVSRHPVEARLGRLGCLKCHGTSFCAACHERNGVGAAIGASNPHLGQADWLRGQGASGHGRAARRRIQDCAACHDQGPLSICVRCHASGGVKPHPPGWEPPVSRKDRTAYKMCAVCHVD